MISVCAESGGYLATDSVGFNMRADLKKGYKHWDFLKAMSNFQAFAFDETLRHLYTLQHNSEGNSGAGGPAIISRYSMDDTNRDGTPALIDQQNSSILISHQTLSVEHLQGGGIKLWGQSGQKYGRALCRYDYSPNQNPSNIETYKLFGGEDFSDSYLTGNISYDQQWLVCRGLSSKRGRYGGLNVISVFKLSDVVNAGPGDVTKLAKWTWTEDPYTQDAGKSDPQAVVSDGRLVYTLYGPLDIKLPNLMRKYTLCGQRVDVSAEITIGKGYAQQLSLGRANEIEGAQFVKASKYGRIVLAAGFLQGGPVYYKSIYVFGSYG